MNIKKSFEKDVQSAHAMSYFNLLRTANWIEIGIKEALKPFGLTHVQLNVLSILVSNYPNAVTAGEIKENIIVASPDVTRLIDRLVKKGFVRRETCPNNRRQMDITITKIGMDHFYRAHFEAKKAMGNFFEDTISKQEAVQLYKTLEKIRR